MLEKENKKKHSLHGFTSHHPLGLFLERESLMDEKYLGDYPTNDKVTWLIKFMKNGNGILMYNAKSRMSPLKYSMAEEDKQ